MTFYRRSRSLEETNVFIYFMFVNKNKVLIVNSFECNILII